VVSFRPTCSVRGYGYPDAFRSISWIEARSACDDGSIKLRRRLDQNECAPSADRSLYKIDHPAWGLARPLSESLEARLANAARTPVRFEVSRLGRAHIGPSVHAGMQRQWRTIIRSPRIACARRLSIQMKFGGCMAPANNGVPILGHAVPQHGLQLTAQFWRPINARRDVASAALAAMLCIETLTVRKSL